jgi:SOS-response transcriptional repressor LexA
MTFYERLEELRIKHNLTKKDIANLCGITPGAVGQWADNNTIPKADDALKIARHFGVTMEYLIEGSGKGKEGELMYSQGAKVQGNNIIPFSPGQNDSIVYIPFYDEVKASAGLGTAAEEYPQADVVPILRSFLGHYNPKNVKMLEVSGDSMTEIHLFSGDIVFFVPVENPADGLYVIGIENNLFVKRLEFDILGQEIKIISENKRFSTQVLKGEDMNRLRVVGKVIGWIHRHPY